MYCYYDNLNQSYLISSKELINENLKPITREEYISYINSLLLDEEV